ncbi:MAG: hypothetical protein HY512_00165 [Candidatus Aenigmarchaeota archaeon]|nr:hypothetical protein [Candidatus Aenigmarchaeota archaeon]
MRSQNNVFLDMDDGRIKVTSVRGHFFTTDIYHAAIELSAVVDNYGRIYPHRGPGVSEELYKNILKEAAGIVRSQRSDAKRAG